MVTYRDLINRMVESINDLDSPAKIRIIQRDGEGTVTHVQHVPIAGFNGIKERIIIEHKDIMLSKVMTYDDERFSNELGENAKG